MRIGIAVLGLLTAVVSSPAQTVLVTDYFVNGTISVIGPGLIVTGTVATPPPSAPVDIAVNPARTIAAVVQGASGIPGRVDFFSLTSNPPSLSGPSVSVAGIPFDIAFSTDGACLVGTSFHASVFSINVSTRTLVSTLTRSSVLAVDVAPPNLALATMDSPLHAVSVLTLGPGYVLTDTGTTVPSGGSNPGNVAVSPNGRIAVVTNFSNSVGVLSISGSTVSFVSSLNVGGSTRAVTFLPDGSRAYVDKLTSVRLLNVDASNSISDSGMEIPIPALPVNFFGPELIATDGSHVFVSNFLGGTVNVIDVATNAVLSPISVFAPTGIAIVGNRPPVLSGVPAASSIPEMAAYTFTATATDPDLPPQTLAFSLVGAPPGAAIGPSSGVFTWTPTEAQGPGTYPFTVRVSDGVASTNAGITITVTEVNVPPVLSGVPPTASIPAAAPYTFTATATDSDIPVQTLVFSLVGGPSGAAIGPSTGVFTWTPTGAQMNRSFPFKVRVSDGVANTDASITIRVGGCAPHTVHGHISTMPPSHSGNVSHEHHGQHGHTVAGDCPPHAPGHSAGLFPDPDEGLFAASPSASRTAAVAGVSVRHGAVLSLFAPAQGFFLGEQDNRSTDAFTPPASGSRRYYTTSLPEVRIGGMAARVLFSGLAPGRKGVWQITIVLPPELRAGKAPVTISYEGVEVQASDLVVE